MDKHLQTTRVSDHDRNVEVNPVRGAINSYSVKTISFMALQIILVMLFRNNVYISTAHALLVLLLGSIWVLTDETPDRAIYVCAYIVGFELIWRGTEALVFWEYGKYAVILLLLLLLLKQHSITRADKRPLVYFILLLPAILLIPYFDREMLAFQLSGPLLLALAAVVFSTISINLEQMKRILVAIIAPAVGLAFMLSFNILTVEEIPIGLATAKIITGGIGPNQVSSILGLGALAAFLYIFVDRQNKGLRIIMFGIMIWLLGQAALTFSRGGFWTALGAMAVAALYLIRQSRLRAAFLITGILLVICYFIFFPALNDFTDGELAARYQNFEQSGRAEIIQGDLLAFKEHPIFGVGIGQSTQYHAIFFRESASHTEYTRLLAEHGMLGVLTLLILIWITLDRVFSKGPMLSKAIVLSLTVWALLFMYHAATRLAAPGFLFGLGAVTILAAGETISSSEEEETGAEYSPISPPTHAPMD